MSGLWTCMISAGSLSIFSGWETLRALKNGEKKKENVIWSIVFSKYSLKKKNSKNEMIRQWEGRSKK